MFTSVCFFSLNNKVYIHAGPLKYVLVWCVCVYVRGHNLLKKEIKVGNWKHGGEGDAEDRLDGGKRSLEK